MCAAHYITYVERNQIDDIEPESVLDTDQLMK